MSGPALLSATDLGFSYGREPVLEALDLTARAGCFTFLLGPNGSGKTTLLRCLLGRLEPRTGRIELGGRLMKHMSAIERARRVAYIPQAGETPFGYRVFEVVLMGRVPWLGRWWRPKAADRQLVWDALERLSIADLADRPLRALSGGQRQLVLVARALVQAAPLLLLDEPVAHLDFGNQQRVLSCLAELCHQEYGVVMSTHQPQHALDFADRVLALRQGRALASGHPKSIMTTDLLSRLYDFPCTVEEVHDRRVVLPGMGSSAEERTSG